MSKEDRNAFNEMKESFKHGEQGAIPFIKGRVDDLLGKQAVSPRVFDVWHKFTCTKLVDLAMGWQQGETRLFKKSDESKNGQDGFTIGHAQKWVNMALKYMLVMGCWDAGLERWIPSLHVPLDSYILGAAHVDEGESIHEASEALGLGIPNSIDSWSKIVEYSVYIDYQDKIREALTQADPQMFPIEWEGPAWIAQAKKNDKG